MEICDMRYMTAALWEKGGAGHLERGAIATAATAAGERSGSKQEDCEQGQPCGLAATRDHSESSQVVENSAVEDKTADVSRLISRGLRQKEPIFSPFLTLNHFDFS
jgi:hypothetical protein